MANFFKMVLATIVGFIIVNMVFFVFSIVFLVALGMADKAPVVVKDNSVLTISLKHPILDRVSDNPFENFDFMTLEPKVRLSLLDMINSIDAAADDDRIKGIYLELSDVGSFVGMATLEELRNTLLEFKKSGKFIYSYAQFGYSEKSYYLASVADSVFAYSEAPMMFLGFGSAVPFYKETLSKLGVKAEVVRVGKFKAAVEPFVADEMSEANREQISTYLGSTWNTLLTAVGESRDIKVDSLNMLANNFRIYTPTEFVEKGLFDGVVYSDQMLDILAKKVNVNEDTSKKYKVNLIDIAKYQDVVHPSFANDEVAIVYAQGEIGMNQTDKSIGPQLAETLRKIREDDNVKSVVLRVNSPGGSALTSDIIWREVELLTQEKPVVVSMGNLAASGGYYISCAADKIFADATTLTGSIGIFGLFFTGEELIKEKMGIHIDVVKTNEHSDFGGSYPLPLPISSRQFTPYEHNVLQQYINRGYETFLSRVMKGRNLTRSKMDSIAEGRVWTGADALNLGLVDEIGGMKNAIDEAVSLASLSDYTIVEYPKEKNKLEQLLIDLGGAASMKVKELQLGVNYPLWREVNQLIQTEGVLARLPYDIEYK